MKISTMLMVTIAIMAVLGGCATVPMASALLDNQAKTFTAPAGKANLYVGRSGNPVGGGIAFQVTVDGKNLGSIGPGCYYLIAVEPGRHSVSVSSNENSAQTKIEASANNNYFVEVYATMGLATARVGINQLDEEHGKSMVNRGKRAEGLLD